MKNCPVTAALVRTLLTYDAESGALTWRTRERSCFGTAREHAAWNTRYAGRTVGCVSTGTGYVMFSLFNRRYLAHRVIWLLVTGCWPDDQIDHIDHDRANNRWANLRSVTHAENGRNQRRRRATHPGVMRRKDTGRWRAEITYAGKNKALGDFATEAEAISARRAAEKRLGFHPNHGRQA